MFSSDEEEFRPTGSQQKYLEYLHAYGLTYSDKKICEIAKLSESEVLGWQKNILFVKWINSELGRIRGKQRRNVLDNLYENAMCGDSSAARLFLAATGGIQAEDMPDVRNIGDDVELIEAGQGMNFDIESLGNIGDGDDKS
jgi:hypothetical protein